MRRALRVLAGLVGLAVLGLLAAAYLRADLRATMVLGVMPMC